MVPLNYILKKRTKGHKFTESQEKDKSINEYGQQDICQKLKKRV